MKRWWRRTLYFTGAVVLVGLGTSLAMLTGVDERSPQELTACQIGETRLGLLAQPGHPKAEELRAGFGRARLTPTLGVAQDRPEAGEFRALPLAGYGNRKGRPAEGVHDDLWVKAIAFATASRTGVVVCADALIVPREVTALAMEQITTATGLGREQVYFSATHTHCSLGGWGEGPVGEAFAGPFQPGVRVWFARQLATAVSTALTNLTSASLGADAFVAPQFIRNRLVGERGRVDPEFSFLVVKQTNGPTAILGSYSAHATVLGGGTMQYSAEYPGAWQRAVERQTGGWALFAAGGVGSHGPKSPQGGFAGVEAMGEALATELMRRLPNVRLSERVVFESVAVQLPLPDLQARLADSVRLRPWVASRFLPVGTETLLQGFRLGDALWFSTPCDFSGELALEVKAQAREQGLRAVVTSFNGDYVGYVIPAKYYHLGGYEPQTMSFFGPQLPDYFMTALQRMTEALAKR